ncbi:hypothetical protein HY484_00785 [Candidatus Woesearchaeota archaeon]|nr:hypothetical protein [Candidatus Woesearchaeota archaeon]
MSIINKRCDCPDVCAEHPDVGYDELIKRGLICEACVRNYNEFLKD